MKLQTSYFNASVLRKDLTRFAPVWVLYSVFWLLVIYLDMGHAQNQLQSARIWSSSFISLVPLNLLYAGLTAALLLGDLFRPRMCNALHAMPLRREGWLLTHSLSALLFALIPYSLSTVVLAVLMPKYLFVALLWFAAAMLEYIFFLGLAVFAGMCAGNWLGMAAMYFILNFFFVLAFALYYLLYQPLLHGIVLVLDEYLLPFVPMAQLTNGTFINYYYKDQNWGILWADWYYLFICVGLGIAAWALSFFLYRKRNLECAGDFVAFRAAAPVFLIFYTLGVGAVLYLLPDLFGAGNNSYLFLLLGILIGFFTGRMFLEKTVRVFRPKNFAGLALLFAVLAGSMALTWFDPLRITYYMPEQDEIVGMRLYSDSDSRRYLYSSSQNVLFTEDEDLQRLQDLHEQMIHSRHRLHSDLNTCDVTVEYHLTDGSIRTRHYSVDPASSLGEDLKLHLSDVRNVLFTDDFDSFAPRVSSAEIFSYGNDVIELVDLPWGEQGDYKLTTEQIPALLEAIKADCDAGVMVQDWAYHFDFYFWLNLEVRSEDRDYGSYVIELRITPDCANTLAYLESIG